MRFVRLRAAALAAGALAGLLAGARPAVARDVPLLDSITVVARRVHWGASAAVTSRADLQRTLEQLGITGVRRGTPLATDLYADGFKRADLGVTVDGERYHCACPNRMDPPTSLAIPIELAAVAWDRTSAAPGAGLAGRLALQRAEPGEDLRLRAAAEGDVLRARDGNGAFALEGRRQRLSARFAAGESYADGGGSSFHDRYGFRDEHVRYSQADAAWRGAAGGLAWGVQGTRTRDVPYAYLLMDERVNDLWNASLAGRGAKVYANHARHLMDNGLRASTMGMTTTANQTTVGALARARGTELEAFGREWDARNTIATPMRRSENHLLPRYRQWSLTAARRDRLGGWTLASRLAVTRASIGDGSVLPFLRTLHAGAEGARVFAPFALGLSRTAGPQGALGVLAEVASEPPTAEQLWITVRRPVMMPRKADWAGNPELAAPLRASLRGQWDARLARLELGGSWVEGYVLPVARAAGGVPYLTYRNVDAALLSGRADGRLGWAEWSTSYTLGWNLAARTVLAEIAPFTAGLTARPPLARGLQGLVRVETAAAQDRLDRALGETRTVAWGRLDAGLTWTPRDGAALTLEVINVTDALYAQHLSFLRDPFASGLRVTEPGRTLRLAVSAGK